MRMHNDAVTWCSVEEPLADELSVKLLSGRAEA
jgi:hypothetical protein